MEYIHFCTGAVEYDGTCKDARFPVWGIIYVDVNGNIFPDSNWYDAVSSLMSMWTAEVVELIHSNKRQCDLYFMDGPFLLNVSVCSNNDILVSCKNRNNTEVLSVTVNLSTFIQELLNCARSFLEECKTKASYFVSTRTYTQIISSCNELDRILAFHS